MDKREESKNGCQDVQAGETLGLTSCADSPSGQQSPDSVSKRKTDITIQDSHIKFFHPYVLIFGEHYPVCFLNPGVSQRACTVYM